MTDGQGIYDAAWKKQYPIESISYEGESFDHYDKGPIDVFQAQLEDKILIRQEYRKSYELLQGLVSAMGRAGRKPCFVLTGQPGIGESLAKLRIMIGLIASIGKTTFLVYLLIQRLQAGLPTALQYLWNSFLLFDKDGVREFPADRRTTDLLPETWALSDSNATISTPCPAFLGSRAVVIQATSPQQSRWKAWRKNYQAWLFVMDLWSRKEMGALLCVHLRQI